ncbi:glycosyltransferase family 4 protein [Aliikangiella sp. IMCC44653]
MKILIVTQWFDPEPAIKGLVFAKELVKKGHSVEVLTGFPNYPGGNVYQGYKIKPYLKEKIDGVVIHRVALYPSHNSSGLKRMLNYLSFALSSCILGLIKVKRPDVIYSYHPPLTTLLSSWVLSKFKKAPLVLDVQDLWPDTLRSTGMISNEKLLNFVAKICDFIYRRADAIVVLSPGFKAAIESRGISSTKIEVIYNWADEGSLRNPVLERSVELPSGFNIVFAGNLGNAQDLSSLVFAVKEVSKDIAFNLVFIGDGIAKSNAECLAQSENLPNVYFLPRVSMNEVGRVLAQADVLLVHLRKDILFTITIPSKTQAYMSLGKPIIMAVEGDAAGLVSKSSCGEVCEPSNVKAIAAAYSNFASKDKEELEVLGDRARDFYNDNLSLEIGVSKFIDVFNRVVRT